MNKVNDVVELLEDYICYAMDNKQADKKIAKAKSAIALLEGMGESPEKLFDHYIQSAIDSAPNKLQRLGKYLGSVLDEDQWPEAERLLNGLAVEAIHPPAQAAVPETVIQALDFYAKGDHRMGDWSDWESVSGEPSNILYQGSDDPLYVEDGAFARRALKKLNAAPALIEKASVPEGYTIVPIEPTDKMIDAGCDASELYRVDFMRSFIAAVKAFDEDDYENNKERPKRCRNRLRDEGFPHPKSGCEVCKTGGVGGCLYDV